LIGILGFIPGVTTNDSSPGAQAGDSLLLGIFGVNALHNLSHLLFAAILIFGGLSDEYVGTINKVMAVIFLVLVVAYFIPPLSQLVNADANIADTLLHLFSALLTGYLGFVALRGDSPMTASRT
jgi:uncharacterized membrane protein YtjA (UPF0391 family)